MTDSALEEMLFPKTKSASNRRIPDYDYILMELLRNGVNKRLSWGEYCEECRMNNEEPLLLHIASQNPPMPYVKIGP